MNQLGTCCISCSSPCCGKIPGQSNLAMVHLHLLPQDRAYVGIYGGGSMGWPITLQSHSGKQRMVNTSVQQTFSFSFLD